MRYIVLFIHALTIAIYNLFFVDPVTITTNFPESAKPGTQFIAEILVKKGALSGFAKLQLELPLGFSAQESDSKSGTFSMAGQTAKIIWTSVPSGDEIVVKMLIKVDASASGDKTVTGKYSYIENNVKQQVEFTPITVKVVSESVATTTETSTTTTTPTVTPVKTDENAAPISVVRNIILGKTPDVFEVELKIKKDAIKGFAKIQEKLPVGYMAVGQKTDGSSFSFSSADHAAKFIWTSLPAQEELVISYKIMPKQGVTPEKPAFLEGEFSYLENQQTKNYTITKQELGSGEPVATQTVEPVVTNTVEPVTTQTVEPVVTKTVEPVVTNTVEPVVTNTVEPVATKTVEPVKTETVAVTQIDNTNVTQPKNSNVNYVVQVGAFKNGVDVNALSKRFNLSGVRTEMQDGYTKCVFGKHGEYKSARDSRETAKAKGVTDAFVAAYNSGQRITVQEALMITSQKWFR